MALFQQHWLVQKGKRHLCTCALFDLNAQTSLCTQHLKIVLHVTYIYNTPQGAINIATASFHQEAYRCNKLFNHTLHFQILQMFVSLVLIDPSPRSNQCTASAHIQRNPHDSFLRLRHFTEHLRSQSSMKHSLYEWYCYFLKRCPDMGLKTWLMVNVSWFFA